MNPIASCLIASVVLLPASLSAWAGTVNSLDALKQAIGQARPGTTIELADGTYQNPKPFGIKGLRGTEESPIVVRAEHPGKAVFGGAAGVVVRDCEYLVIEGLLFTHDADQQAVLLDNCRHVRVTRNTFRLSERAKPRHWEHWVTVDGVRSAENRVDRNLFERKLNRGSHVFVRGDDEALVCSQRDRVDHNHFRDVIYADGQNGHETIRTGGNDLGASGRSSFTTIEDNLLERCSGEDEIVSLKSSDNVFRNNTLLNCRGAICLRLGNRDVVSGNFVIANDGGPERGGVKLYGFEHRVVHNYFCGLNGRRHEAPLALVPGSFETPTTDRIGSRYDDDTCVPPTRCTIAFNTWIDCAPLEFGFLKAEKGRNYLPSACIFANNLVARTRPQSKPLVSLGLVGDLDAHDNLAYAEGTAPTDRWASWFRWTNPQLRRDEDELPLWRLTASSPAIDSAVAGIANVTDDAFGRARQGQLDIGAEEFNGDKDIRGPLTPDDVGPSAP